MNKKMDKETAEGILERLKSLRNLDVEYTNNGVGYSWEYRHTFYLDNFKITICDSEGYARLFGIPVASDGGHSYTIKVDDIPLGIKHSLAKKIHDKVFHLYRQPSVEIVEEIEHIKKDAWVNFKKK
jgi:hypothetical protein